jgi:hypothetical protein
MTNEMKEALSSLDIAILESGSTKKQDDEFTVHDFIDRLADGGDNLTYDSGHHRLRRLVDRKLLKSRVVTINGSKCRVYSKS